MREAGRRMLREGDQLEAISTAIVSGALELAVVDGAASIFGGTFGGISIAMQRCFYGSR